jgi:hypothetical protein
MAAWTADELAKIGKATELRIASRRSDGSLRPYVTIWVVRSGDDLYVRSAYGHQNGWFKRALSSREGRITAGVERETGFEPRDILLGKQTLCQLSYSRSNHAPVERLPSGRACLYGSRAEN